MAVVSAVALMTTPATAFAGKTISVPATANLGSQTPSLIAPPASLGAVTAGDTGLIGLFSTFTASVSCTTFTGPGPATLACSTMTYNSGPPTAQTGSQNVTQSGTITLSAASQTAFTATSTFLTGLLTGGISDTWDPTIVVHVPLGATPGTYTGTITHSVA
jgi:hypothetical protein